jgi:hypothetical protein
LKASVEKAAALDREMKATVKKCDKKADELLQAQKTMAALEKLEDTRVAAVTQATQHLINQDLNLLHGIVTKTFVVAGEVASRRVGIPIRDDGPISVRKCGL